MRLTHKGQVHYFATECELLAFLFKWNPYQVAA